VFFHEKLPEQFTQHFKDISCADLVIIMGTSLKVMPFAVMPTLVKKKRVLT
jgi:NAD-dependent SIR2 family protein deacetylase